MTPTPRAALLALALLLPTACSTPGPERLHRLCDEEWDERLAADPLLAGSAEEVVGDRVLPDASVPAIAARAASARARLEELREIDRESLDLRARIDHAVLERQLSDRLAAFEFGDHLIPITVDDGFHIDFARLPKESPLATVADYDLYVARLRAFPEYARQHVERMRRGMEAGRVMPRVVLEGYEVTIDSHVVDDPEDSVFWAPFEDFPPAVPATEHERLRRAGREAIRDGVVVGYREFLRFFLAEYLPGARDSVGALAMPGGLEYYGWLVQHFTTLDLTPEQVHGIGLDEVARIRGEMDAILAELEFEGDYAAFLEFLRTDPRFYAETPEELLREASWICKRMDARLPQLFGRLPRKPYGVEPVPAHLAPKYTAGRYSGTTADSTEPGWYWVNTYALESRPLYALTALSLHEAVPGHHLQGALAAESEAAPLFRRSEYISAFGEGWALYCEWLGLEVGMYDDPYQDFGRLTYEMWRACRLVVDTGIHAMGWSRDRALEYLATNTALSLHECNTEIDRYISWPGQALSYKLGELKIKELRRRAEETLGEHFDLRAFHDTVLEHGSVPLDVLEEIVTDWIERTLDRD